MPKKSAKSQPTTKATSVVGDSKTQSKWRLGFLLLALLLLVTAGGYTGYGKYQEHSLKAKASGYPKIINRGGLVATACRYNTPWGIGIQLVFTKPAGADRINYAVGQTYTSDQVGRIQGNESHSWWGGTVTAMKLYATSDGWYDAYMTDHGVDVAHSRKIAVAFTPSC